MKKDEFPKLLKEALEFHDLDLQFSTDLTKIEAFDSMSIMAIIAFVDENFSKRFTAKQLETITTVKSLMDLIGIENFSD
jgi:acyl carrier protein